MLCKGLSNWNAVVPVGAVVFINLNNSGFYYCASLYLLPFMNSFQTNRPVTALIISLLVGALFVAGLFVGPLVIRFKVRLVAIVGSILMSLGLVLSAFASSVYTLYFSFGILTGFGMGLLGTSAIIHNQQHSSRWRALASGVAFAGASAGGLCYPLIFRWTEATYGWRGSLMIMGGLQLNNLPAAMLLLPVSSKIETITDKTKVAGMQSVKPSDGQMDENIGADPNMRSNDHPNDTHQDCQELSSIAYYPIHDECRARADKESKTRKKEEQMNIYLSLNHKLSRLRKTLYTGGLASLMCICSYSFKITATSFLYAFLPIRVTAAGLPSSFAAYLFSIMNIGELVGRLIGGAVASFHDRLPFILLIVSTIVAGILEATVGLAQTIPVVTVTATTLGGFIGVVTALLPPVVRDTVGLENFPWVLGLSFGIAGLGFLPILQFLVWIWVKTSSITLMFITAGTIYACAGIFPIIYLCLRGWPGAINESSLL